MIDFSPGFLKRAEAHEAFAQALEKLKGTSFFPKKIPKLEIGEMPRYDFGTHTVKLPKETNIESALHELKHSSDPNNQAKMDLYNKFLSGGGKDPEMAKQLSMHILREEARANSGLNMAFDRTGPKFYTNLLKNFNLSYPGNWSKIKQKINHFNASGGTQLASEENPLWEIFK